MNLSTDILALWVLYVNMANTPADDVHDLDYTKDRFMYHLRKLDIKIHRSTLEALFYCANMAEERGEFWHPAGKSFDSFLGEHTPLGYEYDKKYNVFKEKN